jgi:hypothetical protein
MAKIHDLFIIELAEVIKGYGNDPDVEDPFRLSEFYRFYELPNIAVSRENFEKMRPAQPEQRYTEEELRVFQHGISLSLLSKRSAQHWRYNEDTATEIEFLERLYEKVVADMRGEQDGRFNQQTGGD